MNDNDNGYLSPGNVNLLDLIQSINHSGHCSVIQSEGGLMNYVSMMTMVITFNLSSFALKKINVLYIGSFLQNEHYLPQTFFISTWAQAVKLSWWVANVLANRPGAVWTPWGSSQIKPVWHIVRLKERTSSWKSTLRDSTIRSGTESGKLKPYGCSFVVSHPTWSYNLFKKCLCLWLACHRECILWRKQSTFYFKLLVKALEKMISRTFCSVSSIFYVYLLFGCFIDVILYCWIHKATIVLKTWFLHHGGICLVCCHII